MGWFNNASKQEPEVARRRVISDVKPVGADLSKETSDPQKNQNDSIHNKTESNAANSEYVMVSDIKFDARIIETQDDLVTRVVFYKIINEKIKLGHHLFSRIAVAQLTASSKECILFVDKKKAMPDDIGAVKDLLKNQGYELDAKGIQGFYAVSSIVMALSQGHLDAGLLAIERDIKRDANKSSLMSTFIDIISWAFINKANDIDFAVDTTSDQSQIAFKIGGRYIRPERHKITTATLIQLLGIAWQKSKGGASTQFEMQSEQQAKLEIELPISQGLPDGARVRLRWSGLANDKGTTVTMRLQSLGASSDIKSLKDAGYIDSQMQAFRRVIHSEGGMVVFAGVVGSGKSTSLVQLLSELPRDIKIQTLEDPVELEIPLAYQKTITRDLLAQGPDPAFASATRALYRSALDVLYLGEVRDPETGLVARQVVESGHSVYTTTHARSALGVFDRFNSPAIGIPRDVLATPDIMKLLVYQALLPTTCPHCGKSPEDYALAKRITGKELSQHHAYFHRLHNLYGVEPSAFRLRDPDGCEFCRKPSLPELDGYIGRTVVSELIEPDEHMLEYVLAGNNIDLLRYWRSLATNSYTDSNLTGKTTMECAIYKAAQGIIDPREIEPRFMSFETVEARRKYGEANFRSKK